MLSRLRAMWDNRFLRNNLIVFAGSIGVSALSYAYYPVMARMLPFESFGEVQTLVTLLTQASLIFSSLNVVTVILVASGAEEGKNGKFLVELQKLMTYAVIVVGVLAVAAAPFFKDFLKFQDILPFFAVILAFVVNIPFIFWTSYMQGKENFAGMNVLGLLGAGGKLVVAVVFVLAGLGAFGAILGLLVGQTLALIYVGWRYELPKMRGLFSQRWPDWRVLGLELKFTAMVFVVTLSVTLLYSGDILFVKYYLSPDQAGAYAGIASIARTIFFLTLPFAAVLLPSVHGDWALRGKTLKKSFLLTVGLGGVAVVGFWLAPEFIVETMIGERYAGFAHLLPELSLAVFLISVANLLFYYLLSVRSIASLLISVGGVVLFGALTIGSHASMEAIVNNLTISGAVVLALLLLPLSVWPRMRRRVVWSSIITSIRGEGHESKNAEN